MNAPAQTRPRLFLSPPHMSAAELAYIEEAFRTNYIAPVGPHVDCFEKEFAAHFGFKHAAAVSSGTAAIHLSLILLGVKPGDEVACSTLTFAASANPILYAQARPVFIDSDEATWNMDPGLLEDWLTQRARAGRLPRAVIAVDLYGQCADLRSIAAACARYDIPLVEDSAEALGATYAGKAAGGFGKVGIFSFNGNKIITTSGGGMLVSDDAELVRQDRFLSTQARDPAAHYQHSQLGFNYRMSNVLAGIGRAQLQVLTERVNARRRIYDHYLEGLGDLPGLRFMPEAPLSRSNRWLTCLTIDPAAAPVNAMAVLGALEKENIEARPVWKPLHLQPVFAGCEFVGSGVSQRLFEQGICLPSGSAMTVEDQMRVVEIVRECFGARPVRPGNDRTEESRGDAGLDVPLFELAREQVRDAGMKAVRNLLAWGDRHVGRRGGARFATVLLIHAVMLWACFALSYELRWDFSVPENFRRQAQSLMLPVILCKLILLYSFGQFRSLLSYFSLADFAGVLLASSTVSALMLGLWYLSDVMAAPPRAVILTDFVLSMGLISAFRLALRVARVWGVSGEKRAGLVEKRVIVVGTGREGANFARDLLRRSGCGLVPVCFLEEGTAHAGRSVHGLPVYGPLPKLPKIAARFNASELIITDPGIAPARIKEIVEMARAARMVTQIAPIAASDRAVALNGPSVRPVAIEDILGRPALNLHSAGIGRLVRDRVVLVTGAGGSIGSELCRQVLAHQPRLLVMVDQAEIALFEIEQELLAGGPDGRLRFLIADVADEAAMKLLFEEHRPEIIFHAAAHKHVPLMERQPAEALKNNTLATASLARLASEQGVGRFVFISTDKAINPTSVMGCSKRLAEKALQARQAAPGNRTAFLAVRFGNVLGSSGSVIPMFRRQIAQGGPVTITHPDMTRYFMTIPEAVGLVLQTATLGEGGEIFVLDMGQPVKILEMARQMIGLSGYKPGTDIEIKITGLRPGEKLFEELCHAEETHLPTEHPRIFKLRCEAGAGKADLRLAELSAAVVAGSAEAIKRVMKGQIPEYTPFVE